jgi:3-phosphoshikimate 1-carboxyvinyltransferase
MRDLLVSGGDFRALEDRSVNIPGDKSISHRVLLLAAILPGPTRINGLNEGGAVQALKPALQTLGVRLEEKDGALTVTPPAGGLRPEGVYRFNLGSSSTAARLLLGLLSGLGIPAVIDGDASLRARPMDWVVTPLRQLGANLKYLGIPGRVPVLIENGRLRPGQVRLEVVSAQASSAILFGAFAAGQEVEISLVAPSRDHTTRLLRHLGVKVEETRESIKIVDVNYPPLPEYQVPGDPSAAAFLAGACVCQGGPAKLTVEQVCLNPTRLGFFELLGECGVAIDYADIAERYGEPVGNLRVGGFPPGVRPFHVDQVGRTHAMIDEIPLAAALATLIPGTSSISQAGELAFKETDRLQSTRNMLRAFGAEVEATPDSLQVRGGLPLKAGVVPSFGDHRLAMAAAALACALPGRTRILGGECYQTSFPEFSEKMRYLGFGVHLSEGAAG